MKNQVKCIAGLFLVFLFSLNTKAAGSYKLEYDSLSCLQIEGKVVNAEEGAYEECLVELISQNEIQQSIVLKEGKNKFKFVLSKNTFYSIRISKKGFISKLISVNTEILTAGDEIHLFKFETSLLNEAFADKLNDDAIDFPVTIIQYDYEMECFLHNQEYTAYIKKELYKPVAKAKRPKTSNNGYTLDTTDLAVN